MTLLGCGAGLTAGPPPFDPVSTTPALLLNAASGLNYTDTARTSLAAYGDSLAALGDLSGNANHPAQPDGSMLVTLGNDDSNSACWVFPGDTPRGFVIDAIANLLATNHPFTVVMGVHLRDPADANGRDLFAGGNSSDTNSRIIYRPTVANQTYAWWFPGGALIPGNAVDALPRYHELSYDGTTATQWLDSASVSDITNSPALAIDKFTFGYYHRGGIGPVEACKALVTFFAVWPRVLTPTERGNVRPYVQAGFVALPPDPPFASGAATPFIDPTSYAGVKFYLRPENYAGAVDGGTLATLTDSSGQGNDFVSPSSGERVTYRASVAAFGGKPATQFNSAQCIYNDAVGAAFGSGSATQPYTVFMEVYLASPGTVHECLFMLCRTDISTPTHDGFVRSESKCLWSDRRSASGENSLGTGVTLAAGMYRVGYSFNGKYGRWYLEGARIAQGVQGSASDLAATTFTLGAHRRTVTDSYLNGYIRNAVGYNVAFTDAQHARLAAWSAADCGVALSPPAFDPAQFGVPLPLVVWHRGDSLNASNDPWYDKAGGIDTSASTHDAPKTGTATYAASWQNGRAALTYAAGGYHTLYTLVPPAITTYKSFTAWCVFDCDSVAANRTLWSVSDGGATGDYVRVYLDTSAHVVFERRAGGSTTTLTSTATVSLNTPHYVTGTYSYGTVTVWLDGVKVITAGAAGAASATFSTGAIAGLLRAAISERHSGHIAEFGLCLGAAPDATVTQLHACLVAYYGL